MKTVGDLIIELKEVDPSLYVIMSTDEEGNEFGYLEDVAVSRTVGEGRDIAPVHPDDIGTEFDEEGLGTAVVLWP